MRRYVDEDFCVHMEKEGYKEVWPNVWNKGHHTIVWTGRCEPLAKNFKPSHRTDIRWLGTGKCRPLQEDS